MDTEDKPNQFSIRFGLSFVKAADSLLTQLSESEDDQEDCSEVRMHSMQDKSAVGFEKMQTFRAWVSLTL